jgi:hypothetical protein
MDTYEFTMKHRGLSRKYVGKLTGIRELAEFGLRIKGVNTVAATDATGAGDPIEALDALMRRHGFKPE